MTARIPRGFFAEKKLPKVLGAVGIALVGMLVYLYSGRMELLHREPLKPPPADAPYLQKHESAEVRLQDLVSRMTLEEKIGQMALVDKNSIQDPDDVRAYGLGAVISGAGAKPDVNTPKGWKTLVAGYSEISKASRLGIPIFYGVDAIHGHGNVPGAVIFPHAIGLGASYNPTLVESIARATAQELAATGVNWSFSPTLDMPEDIRWGRTYESFGSDPVLVATLGAAYLRGLQSVHTEDGGVRVLGTPKHFVGAGSMEWGSSSNKDFHIDQGTTRADDARLRAVYLPPFAATIEAGAQSIMVGLNSWGDTKLSAEKYLLTDVLKGEMGFKGFLVSDWYGVYEIPGTDYSAAVAAINAGIDMVMLPFDYKTFVTNVTRAVRRGDITEARIDDAVLRILNAKFASGLFDDTTSKPTDTFGAPEHRQLARTAVSESLVLLKNKQRTLPLTEHLRHIRVAGSAADNVGLQAGAWTIEWQGIDGNWLPGGTSLLSGIRTRAGKGTTVEYSRTGDFGVNVMQADIGIAIVGEKPYAEGWGDNEYPTLSEEDMQTIKKLRVTSDKVVVIVVSGRPLFMSDVIASADAVVAAWLPGSEGEGVVDVLFGDVPWKGKLPLAWPDHIEQLPITTVGSTRDGSVPLFPRYFGLR